MLKVGDKIFNKDNKKHGIIIDDKGKLKYSNNNLKNLGANLMYIVKYDDSNENDCVSSKYLQKIN
jgi:hypothetical protein